MLNIVWVTIAIYLFFIFMGWGITRLILQNNTRSYQFWLFPWFGLILAEISALWCSRLGLGTDQSIYLVSLLGASFLILCKFLKVPLSVPFQRFDGIIAFGSLISLFLALSPLFAVENPTLTTISLGNGDAPVYAQLADFLRNHSINQPPPVSPDHPFTAMISAMLEPGVRPGCWLVFALLASLFNLAAYKIFTLFIGVFFALTPSLITIFTLEVNECSFAAIIALTLSVLNVNLLFFNYHGFGAQVLGQGCLILAFFWFYLIEKLDSGDINYYYLLPLGLSISSLFSLYPEMGIFFLVPIIFYISFNLIQKTAHKRSIIKNFALIFAVTLLIDPLGFWNGLRYALLASKLPVGWDMPRWAFPVDMVGLLSIHSGHYSNFLLIVSSLPILGIIALGLSRWHNRTLALSIFAFGIVILVWLSVVRKFSYGYYKATGFLMFAIIIAFSVGLVWSINLIIIAIGRRFQFSESSYQLSALYIVGLFSAMAICPTFHQMLAGHLRVTPELANLTEVPKVAKDRKVYVDTSHVWEQLWAINFLRESPITFLNINPYNPQISYNISSAMKKGGLWLTRNWAEDFINTDELLWQNNAYSLVAVDEQKIAVDENKISIRFGENWWGLDKWWGETSDSKAFRWVNQDATLQMDNEGLKPTTIVMKLKLVPILPKTTLDVYLNNKLVETVEVDKLPRFYPIHCPLKSGNNQVRLHVREGAIHPGGDPRKIALGVNAIRFTSY